ncbi:MAG: phosphoenolpyruvate synthase [Natronomonas sp.]
MAVLWLDEIDADDIGLVGGKGASLGEMTAAGLPVPPGFVVTAGTYRTFLEEAGIEDELFEAVDIDSDDSAALAEAEAAAKELILETPLPDPVRQEILSTYDGLDDGEAFVAVRSSATAEDLPSIAAEESALLRVDGEPVFGRMEEIAPLDCGRQTVEVPAMTDDGIEWAEADRLYEHDAESETLHRITTATGRQITVTPDHSLVVLNEDTLEPETACIEDLDGDEMVPVVRDLPSMDTDRHTIDVTQYLYGEDVIRADGGVMIDNDSSNASIQQSLPQTIDVDEDFAYFLGLYVAEGSTYEPDHEISITNTDEEILDRAIDVMDRFGLWNEQAKNGHSYRFHCKSLVRFLHAVAGAPDSTDGKGRLAGNKRVPEFVFGWDADRIGAFLRGCFDGDGTVGSEISYATTSERLVEGLSRLLELLGVDYRIGERDGDGEWSDSYRIHIPARDAERFADLIGFDSAAKRDELRELIEDHEQKSYHPEFARTITVSPELSGRIREKFEETLPTEDVTVAHCPDCTDEINKSSPYDGRSRWYCPACGAAYYEDEVEFRTESRYDGRDDGGRFDTGESPWNKGHLSGTYSQSRFDERLEELGVDSMTFDDSLAWEPIQDIETVEYDGSVYDFCVPDAENFAAGRGSVITHNTASFAGQQETFLNITREDLVERVKQCWASLFTQRAIYYRNEQGFDHSVVDIAVVVQRMVDAEKSGVMFTSHPSTGDPQIIIEAAWGLGEAVVSGSVSPDNYVVDRETREVIDVTVADKKMMMLKDEETGETVEREVPEDRRKQQVLTNEEIEALVEIGERAEDHYGEPQDVEWALVGGEVFMLQSRPITTIADDDGDESEETDVEDVEDAEDGDVILRGLGASPGIVSGPVRTVKKLDQLDKVGDGDVLVTEMTTPDMVPAMKRACGIITDEGGMTSHAAIISRELGVPAVVGCGNATRLLEDDQPVTLDGDKGTVRHGKTEVGKTDSESTTDTSAQPSVKPMTGTEVKVNVSIPEAAERAAATGADGVGLLRTEHLILSTNKTPNRYIEDHGEDAYVSEIVDGVRQVADAFYPRPVRVRTLDAPTDEFRQLEGGEGEPHEHNPMLGWRGIRRSLDTPDTFKHELEAFRRLFEMGYDNVEVMFPLVTDGDDVAAARDLMAEAGIDPESNSWGVMIETPSSALSIEEIIAEGVDFVSFGTNDLTQYTLAVDRNNSHVSDQFDELHPAVLNLIEIVIEACNEHGVKTSICGQAASEPEMVQFLVNEGIFSISANIDAVHDIQHEVKRREQQLILDSVR